VSTNYPKKPALRLSSIEEQTQKINAAALELVGRANAEFSGTRTVTKKAALTVVSRSLAKNESDAFSIRKHKALTELSHYITLAQSNKALTASVENTDLLPIAHPRSTRDNDLTLASLLQYRARWINDDPDIKDEAVKELLLSAFTSHPASVEYEYALTRLSSMPQGMVPQYALVAALGDGNSTLARRMRALKQRRDRKGRFAEMGGGLRALIKRAANGLVQSLTGTAVSQSIDGEYFDMELPDGRLVRVPTGSAEGVKAILPSMRTKDGYSKTPAKVSIGDPVVNESDLEVIDAPSGFQLDETWSPSADDVDYYGTKIDLGKKYTDDAYDVIKFDSPNASAKDKFEAAQQKEAEGQNIVTEGLGKDGWLDPNKPVYFVSRRDGKEKTFAAVQTWADVQDYISQDEPKYENNEGVDPSKAQTAKAKAAEKKALLKKVKSGIEQVADKKAKEEKPKAEISDDKKDFDYPEGFYKIKKGEEYTPEGPIDGQVSPDYSDDPAEIAQKFETDDIVKALEKGVSGTKKQPATGFGVLPFEAGDEIVPAEALYNALKEKGEDADAILANIYSGGKKPDTAEVTPEVSDEVKDAIDKGDIEGTSNPEGDGDPATLPPLLEGLSEDEKAAYAESGDYTKYLPKNATNEAPAGYTELNEDPFNNAESVIPEDAPEGFTFDPVEVAKSYKQEGLLEKELRRSLEPGNEMPGYGIISQETPEGEDYIGYIPGEAIRDALQLQGVDTNALINKIYAEGAENEPTPQETQDALEGETPETTQGTPTEQEAPTESSKPIATNEAGPEATTVNTGEPTGPAKLRAKVTELKAGDVTTRDFFTITKVEPGFQKKRNGQIVPASQITGYYPGGAEQSSKLWADDVSISVYRNVEAPTQGDLPELNQPEMSNYGKLKPVDGKWQVADPAGQKEYEEDYAKYKAQLDSQKALWSEPEGLERWQTENLVPVYTPENPVGVSEVASVDVKAGDITFKKEGKNDFYEFFVVEGVSTDEEGNAVVQGYYPGHESQTKTWKGTTKIQVIKGATAPEAGTKPALERPKKDDPDYKQKYAEFNAAKKESAATWTAPIDLEAAAPKPKAKKPTSPSFQGDKLKAIAEAAAGDPKKFKELIAQEEVVHIDFETTGNSWTDPSPLQVALVKTKNGEVVDSKVIFMNPEEALGKFYTDKDPSEILKDSDGNPISDAFLEKQMSQEDAFKQIMEFMGPNPIVLAHNMPFDGGILKSYASKFKMDYNPSGEIDTLSLARKVINGGKNDHVLQAVANRYDLAGPDTDWHDASVDVAVLPSILDNLLDEMAITGSGLDALDVDKNKIDFDAANDQYFKAKDKEVTAETELIVSKVYADGMAGKDVPSTEEMSSALSKDLLGSDELSPATTPKPSEVSDNDEKTQSIFGDFITNNWVSDNENTTNVGKIAVEDMKPGDFISAQHGGYHEIISVEPDPDNDKKMVITRRLLANGKEYKSSWIKYQAYEVRRRNAPLEIEETPVETPEVEQPILETDEAPEKESSAGTWNGYKISQGTDGVYYAENISSTDVQALRNGQLTPPQLPFFAPLGGGNDQETGEGYFFSVNGKRFWGKYGAAGALVRRKNSDGVYEYFLAKRSSGLSQEGGKWGFPGGAHKDQTIAKSVGGTAKEEFSEEVGGDLSSLEPKYIHQNFVGPEWAYDTYVFEVGPKQLSDLTPKDAENSEIGWFTADQINQMAADGKLHTNFAESAQAIFDLSEDNTKGPEKPTPAESKSTEVKAFDTTNWKKIAGQAGSNEGAFYVDPDTGEQYYVKKPKSDKHAANEALASALYAEAGTKIGRVYLGKDKSGKTVLVSPLVENSKKDFSDKKSDSAILKSAQEDFAVDAWLNNYDSVGLAYDNMLTVDGDVYRVDPGGSLLFRAQGKDKSSELTDDVKSIDSLRDGSINSESNDIFGSMTDEQIAESAKKVQAISPEKIDQLVDQAFPDDLETASFLKEKLKARREDLIKRFGLEPQEEEALEPVQSVSDTNPATPIDPSGDVAQQLNDFVGKKVSFLYGGKDRIATVIPSKEGTAQIWENPKNGKTNVRLLDSDGKVKNFTIANMEANSEGFEAPKEAPKPSTEAPAGWAKEGNYTWKKDGWLVTESTEGELTASNPKLPGNIYGNSWDEIQTQIDAENITPSIPQVATPEEIKAIAESPDGGITPSANDNIEPFGGNPPANSEPDADPQPTDKPTEVSQAEKVKLLEELSSIAEKVFGKAPNKEALKSLLNTLKDQGGNPDLIDSIVDDLDAPEPKELETAADKIAADIAQDLIPEDDNEGLSTPTPLTSTVIDQILSSPSSVSPELIWNNIKEAYEGSILDSGHIVVNSVMHGEDRYDVVVRRNEDNSFSVYHRVTKPDGTSKVYVLKAKNHSAEALKNKISAQIANSLYYPNRVKKNLKPESAQTLLPTSVLNIPTQTEAFVSGDGVNLKKGDVVEVANPTHSKFGQTAKIIYTKKVMKSNGKGYTDYLKVKYEDGEENQIVSKSVKTLGSSWSWGQPKPDKGDSDGGSGGTPVTPTPSPTSPSSPSAPTPKTEKEKPAPVAPSLKGATSIADVEAKSFDKNSIGHTSYYGASTKQEYKDATKQYMVKDGTSDKYNMLPGILVSNSQDEKDPELTSHGVITKTYPEDDTVDVAYFDGPLSGQSKNVSAKTVFSKEKFITSEQASDLGIEVDNTPRDAALKVNAQKAEAAKKLAAELAEKEKFLAEQKALKAKNVVNGPGFEVEEPSAPVSWSTQTYDNIPPLDAIVKKATSDNPRTAAVGASTLVDGDSIEDLEVRVAQVQKDGEKKLRVSFMLTDWAGNDLVKLLKGKKVKGSKTIELDKYETEKDGKVSYTGLWDTSSVDPYDYGSTYKGAAGKGEFQFHRSNKNDSTPDFFKQGGSKNGSVSLHNRVEILLPIDATPEDIAKAIEEIGGVKSVRPATDGDVRGMLENKMISIFGNNTNGSENYTGELRKKHLDEIKKKWNFTAKDMSIEVDPLSRGRIYYLVPESVKDQIMSLGGYRYFKHEWKTSNLPEGVKERADFVYNLLFTEGGGLYSTTQRWTEGINTKGKSSWQDLAGAGANYIYTTKVAQKKTAYGSSKGMDIFFDGDTLLRRIDFYSNQSDGWGLLKPEADYVNALAQNPYEVLWKKNVSWADLATISLDSPARELLLERLKKEGITELWGKKVTDVFGKAGA
jgi:DNA polymerase III epsilon subunit-like protein/ADP-ribose pyrophosphatase YjhB (NUDIX family)